MKLAARLILSITLGASASVRAFDAEATSAEQKAPPNASPPPSATPGVSETPSADKQTAAKKKASPTVFGFMQAHFRHARDTGGEAGVVDATNFRMQRVRIGVKGDIFPWLSYQVEIDPRSPEITGVLRDAYMSFDFIPDHELRVGQQKTQFGYENTESSSELFAVNRTELADTLSRGINLRDIGVGLIGHVKLGGGFRFEDAITVVNGAGLNVQADNTRRKNVWGRVGVRYKNKPGDLMFRFGLSGATGDLIDEGNDPIDPRDDFRQTFNRLGTDVQIDHKRFFLSAEYVKGHDENALTGGGDDRSGYYVSVAGKTRFDVGPILRLDTLGEEFRRFTVGAYYALPKAPLRVMLNYEFRKLRDGARADDKFYVWTQVRF